MDIVYKPTKGCFELKLDGKKYLLSEDFYLAMPALQGLELSEEDLKLVEKEDANVRAMDVATRYLSYKRRTKAEVRRRLEDEQVSQERIEEILRRLERRGALNDASYAEEYVFFALERKHKSFFRVRMELKDKGVPDSFIERALKEYEGADFDNCLLQAEKRYKGQDLSDYKEKAKFMRSLSNLGFPHEAIRYALEELDE